MRSAKSIAKAIIERIRRPHNDYFVDLKPNSCEN